MSTLTAESEELTAKIEKLANEMAELSDAIAAIDAAVCREGGARELPHHAPLRVEKFAVSFRALERLFQR